MKVKKILSEQWVSVYILIAAAILYFIYSLGFMTNFYRLFYDGNSEMYDLYQKLQLLNKFIFENALITLILAIVMLILEVNMKKTNIFNTIFLVGFIIYHINSLGTLLRAIPYYKNLYLTIDFSSLENYIVTPFMFSLIYVFSGIILALLFITGVLMFFNFYTQIHKRKGVKSYD